MPNATRDDSGSQSCDRGYCMKMSKRTDRSIGYKPFADVPTRNKLQTHLEIPLLVRALGLRRGGKVLEIGCGRGVALPEISRRLRPTFIAGLDADRDLLDIAATRVDGLGGTIVLIHADARAIPAGDSSFDLVIDFGTCYHIDRAEHAIREVFRVLKPGGIFVHETRASQLLAHPLRSLTRRIPWHVAPRLVPARRGGLWTARQKLQLYA